MMNATSSTIIKVNFVFELIVIWCGNIRMIQLNFFSIVDLEIGGTVAKQENNDNEPNVQAGAGHGKNGFEFNSILVSQFHSISHKNKHV